MLVAWNVRYYREQAEMTQKELAEHLGTSDKNISAIELSARPGTAPRRFNAEDIVRLAVIFRVPVSALLLPPLDDGISKRYLIHPEGADCLSMPEYLPYLDSDPDPEDESPSAAAYARRWSAVADPGAAEALAAARKAAQEHVARPELLERLARQRAVLAEVIADIDGQTEVIAEERV